MKNFNELEMKYGASMAYGVLLEIEKATGIKSANLIERDPEVRLANAYRIQDAMTKTVIVCTVTPLEKITRVRQHMHAPSMRDAFNMMAA